MMFKQLFFYTPLFYLLAFPLNCTLGTENNKYLTVCSIADCKKWNSLETRGFKKVPLSAIQSVVDKGNEWEGIIKMCKIDKNILPQYCYSFSTKYFVFLIKNNGVIEMCLENEQTKNLYVQDDSQFVFTDSDFGLTSYMFSKSVDFHGNQDGTLGDLPDAATLQKIKTVCQSRLFNKAFWCSVNRIVNCGILLLKIIFIMGCIASLFIVSLSLFIVFSDDETKEEEEEEEKEEEV